MCVCMFITRGVLSAALHPIKYGSASYRPAERSWVNPDRDSIQLGYIAYKTSKQTSKQTTATVLTQRVNG